MPGAPRAGATCATCQCRFNRMTRQLRQQRAALVQANETNEKRRQFTEAVVEGVSAGIVGLDPFGAITLVNATRLRHVRQERSRAPAAKTMPR